MNEEIKKLDAEIQKRFHVSGQSEFILNDKYKLYVSNAFGQGDPAISVMNLEDPNEGSKPLEYIAPDVLKIIQDNFKFTSPDNNPFMNEDPEDEDPIDDNPFID